MKLMEKCNGLQHLGIPTEDLEKSKEFYTTLGFEVYHEKAIRNGTQHVAFLKSGNLILEVYEEAPTVKTAGAINHFAIDCLDIEGCYKKVCDEGYTILSEGIEDLPFYEHGVRYFIIEGPNKERVEFNQVL